MLSSLDHPNVIGFKEFFMDSEGSLCIVTTYCEHGDLFHLIRERKNSGKLFEEEEVQKQFIYIVLIYICKC